jgi:hypothetical protein
MTTGRINQVTILNAVAARPPRHLARAGQSSSLTGGRGPRPPGSLERCYNRALAAIRLPPLSFPRDRPPHEDRAPERHHQVRSRPLRGRVPSAGPRPVRDGNLLRPTSDCLGRVVPGGQPSTDSNRAYHAEAGESSGALTVPPCGGALSSRGAAAYAGGAGAVIHSSRGLPATGQRPRDLETEPVALRGRPFTGLHYTAVRAPRAQGVAQNAALREAPEYLDPACSVNCASAHTTPGRGGVTPMSRWRWR